MCPILPKLKMHVAGDTLLPYGVDGEGEVYVPDSEAAQVVREIFLYAAEGDTTSQIAGKHRKLSGHAERGKLIKKKRIRHP